MSYFKVLGVPEGSSLSVCKSAYRKLSKVHHPDLGGSEDKFRQITEAWEGIKSGRFYPNAPTQTGYSRAKATKFYHKNIFTILKED